MDGRYNSAAAPDEQIMHSTPGYSRDHRPDLNHVMLALLVEQPAGIPLLMKPRSGNTHDQVACGRIITEHVQPLHTAHQATYLVADSALDTAEHLGHLSQRGVKWMTRVPATLAEVHAVLARMTPETMTP